MKSGLRIAGAIVAVVISMAAIAASKGASSTVIITSSFTAWTA